MLLLLVINDLFTCFIIKKEFKYDRSMSESREFVQCRVSYKISNDDDKFCYKGKGNSANTEELKESVLFSQTESLCLVAAIKFAEYRDLVFCSCPISGINKVL